MSVPPGRSYCFAYYYALRVFLAAALVAFTRNLRLGLCDSTSFWWTCSFWLGLRPCRLGLDRSVVGHVDGAGDDQLLDLTHKRVAVDLAYLVHVAVSHANFLTV